MADIRNSINGDLIRNDEKLRELDLQVRINEKLNHLKALEVHLDNLRTVQMKQVELKKEALKKEISELQRELKSPSPRIIDVNAEEGGK